MDWPPQYSQDYLPPEAQEYWSPDLETMPPEQRDEIILEKLRRQVAYAFTHSGFYREFYADSLVDPLGLNSLAEFAELPILTKEDVRREQEQYPPYGRFLCIPPEEVFRIHGTSGTTGRPTVFGIGRDDWERIAEAHARILWGAGLRPGDTVMVAAVFSLYVGSWGALAGSERLGATSFPFGGGAPGQTERAAEWAAMIKPTALYATPSYALYLAETARRMGLDPKEDFSFRLMHFSGEPGASVPSTRRLIEETYGCYVVDQGSMAEMTPWMSNSGCRHLDAGMHLWQDVVYTELVDPQTKRHAPSWRRGGAGLFPHRTHLTADAPVLVWRHCALGDGRLPLRPHLSHTNQGNIRPGRRHDHRPGPERLSVPDRRRAAQHAGVRRRIPAGPREGNRRVGPPHRADRSLAGAFRWSRVRPGGIEAIARANRRGPTAGHWSGFDSRVETGRRVRTYSI